MKNKIIILSVVILVGGFIFFYRNNSAKQQIAPVVSQTGSQTDMGQHWAPKEDNQAMITVAVTPIEILSQSKEWKFNIAMNTHSVELQNPIKSSILVDDKGKEYKPINWDGPKEGHHMNGVLTFSQITPIPKSIELKISGEGGVVRSFIW